MSASYDCVVIGGGIVGAAAARRAGGPREPHPAGRPARCPAARPRAPRPALRAPQSRSWLDDPILPLASPRAAATSSLVPGAASPPPVSRRLLRRRSVRSPSARRRWRRCRRSRGTKARMASRPNASTERQDRVVSQDLDLRRQHAGRGARGLAAGHRAVYQQDAAPAGRQRRAPRPPRRSRRR